MMMKKMKLCQPVHNFFDSLKLKYFERKAFNSMQKTALVQLMLAQISFWLSANNPELKIGVDSH